jgi:hypothetical protein
MRNTMLGSIKVDDNLLDKIHRSGYHPTMASISRKATGSHGSLPSDCGVFISERKEVSSNG